MDAISTGCKEFREFIKISQTFIAFAYAKVGLPIISFKCFLEGKKKLHWVPNEFLAILEGKIREGPFFEGSIR